MSLRAHGPRSHEPVLSNTHTVRVRYAETDKAGMVHHAAYLVWFEEGRVELLRSLGSPYRTLEARGIHFPVRDARCRYRAVALFDDALHVTTTVRHVGGASVRFGYRIVRPTDDAVIVEGMTEHACVDDAGRVQRLPRTLRELLAGVRRMPPSRTGDS